MKKNNEVKNGAAKKATKATPKAEKLTEGAKADLEAAMPSDKEQLEASVAAKLKSDKAKVQAKAVEAAVEAPKAKAKAPKPAAAEAAPEEEAPAKAEGKAGKVASIGVFQPATVRIKTDDGKTIHVGLKACKCSACGVNEPPCWHVNYVFAHRADFEKIGAAFNGASVVATKTAVAKKEEAKAKELAEKAKVRAEEKAAEDAKKPAEGGEQAPEVKKPISDAPKQGVKAATVTLPPDAKPIKELGFAVDQLVKITYIHTMTGKEISGIGYVMKEEAGNVFFKQAVAEKGKTAQVILILSKNVLEAVKVKAEK